MFHRTGSVCITRTARAAARNYFGVTAGERRDIMGAGNVVRVIKWVKDVVHDDFAPFEAIAKTWGEQHLTGAAARCDEGSAV